LKLPIPLLPTPQGCRVRSAGYESLEGRLKL
jgi:hypothetical protein